MGCYPLGKMVSRAFSKCTGKQKRASKVVILSPPPSYTYTRPQTMVRSVNFSNDNPIIVIPPDSNQTVTLSKPHLSELPTHHHPSSTTPVAVEHKEPSKVRFSPGPDIQRASPPQSDPAQPKQTTVKHNPPHCYVMSPLPRWEERPRRREYFSGEYSYYPTPLREGIYSIATDANRLTTIFSEENPNACSIA